MTVICINDTNRPNEIPSTKWIKKGDEYTVVDMIKCNIQGGMHALILEEIDLTGCEPYKGFNANRFIPTEIINELELEEIEEAKH